MELCFVGRYSFEQASLLFAKTQFQLEVHPSHRLIWLHVLRRPVSAEILSQS